jgi:hypothetical protein
MGATPPSPARRRGGLTFPVFLLALGFIFLADHVVPGWGIHKTWPALLIVIGVCKLVDATRPPRPPEGPRV